MNSLARIFLGRLFVAVFALSFLVPVSSSAGLGETMINTISHNSEAEGAEIVDFWLIGDVAPKIFRIPGENPRLVIDFFNVGYGGPTQIEPENPNLVQRIRVGFHNIPEPKTRVVIDLLPNEEIVWEKASIHHNNTLRFSFKAKGRESVTLSSAMLHSPPEAPAVVPVLKAVPSKVKKERPAQVASGSKGTGGNAAQSEASPGSKAQKAAAGKPPERSILQDVAFDDLQVRNGEMILFKLNKFYPPTISAREKGRPRVICDFENTIISRNIESLIQAKGKFVDTIEVAAPEEGLARVVLNLYPGKDYDLQQVFFQEDRLFVLIVSDLAAKN